MGVKYRPTPERTSIGHGYLHDMKAIHSPFKTIGLISKRTQVESLKTSEKLVYDLSNMGYNWVIADDLTGLFAVPDTGCRFLPLNELGKHCDLIVVIGGDGHVLSAARSIFQYKIPLVGINRSRLGFLADIVPSELPDKLVDILNGNYQAEKRHLLKGAVYRQKKIIFQENALNEIVLHPGGIARMIEFEIFIDGHFVLRQRSDGLIAATPTGSTAYALSGGGPIVTPALNATVLVPMFPHTLSSRPLVVNGQSRIELLLIPENTLHPRVSWDGHHHQDLNPGDRILITQQSKTLQLLHPIGYDYFATLREKLGWK
ncbi:MAG: inorganic polyphosphate/ATP-NAD kinase [Pseudomonadota bacterium]